MHTVKPIDVAALEKAANETRAIVVAEEHLAYGGLGSAVAMVLAERKPTKMAFVDVGDTYATSGKPDELLRQYGLTPDAIIDATRRVPEGLSPGLEVFRRVQQDRHRSVVRQRHLHHGAELPRRHADAQTFDGSHDAFVDGFRFGSRRGRTKEGRRPLRASP